MEQSIDKIGEFIQNNIGNDTDALIIIHKDGEYGISIKGSAEEIAKAYFFCMHKEDTGTAMSLFNILLMNVMNMLSNNSKYAKKLMDNIVSFIREAMESGREKNEEIEKRKKSPSCLSIYRPKIK